MVHTYDRELLAMYISVKRFRHMLEGRDFIIYTDQKPLMYAFMQNPDKCSPRQWRHLDFISQFSTDVRHINGTRNAVALHFQRIEVNQISNSFLDFEALSKAQLEDNELQSFQNDEKSSLVFKRVELICDTSTSSPRPFVPHNFRRTILSIFNERFSRIVLLVNVQKCTDTRRHLWALSPYLMQNFHTFMWI
ncbi:retrovirus-related Pol polyprotein from transposon 17.6 [Trichonephila clavipes]|nr:retrovirus-related Pol polyprotein from transposon 17.6 [Trichonephila clavipes]